MLMKLKLFILIILPIFLSCEVRSKTSEKPKSIILFIGYCMGVDLITSAIFHKDGYNFLWFTNGGLVLTVFLT